MIFHLSFFFSFWFFVIIPLYLHCPSVLACCTLSIGGLSIFFTVVLNYWSDNSHILAFSLVLMLTVSPQTLILVFYYVLTLFLIAEHDVLVKGNYSNWAFSG